MLGRLRIFVGANPIAGAEIDDTVPAGVVWLLRSMQFQLVTVEIFLSRRVHVLLDSGTGEYQRWTAADTQFDLVTRDYRVQQFGFQPAFAQPFIFIASAPHAPLISGQRIRTVTDNLGSLDDFGPATYAVEQWPG